MGEPETTTDFYDYCARCSTCTWCSWHGRCLAECVPSDFALGDTFAQLRADLASSVRQTLKDVAAVTMIAQSDPHATAAEYRAALIKACNLALAGKEA